MSYSKRPIRRSALIGPWGVGAIVPFPGDESLMVAGLDMWRYGTVDPFLIEDERLRKRLNVKELRWPPDFREKNADPENCNLTIPTVRFPTWLYCPFCGTMKKVTYYSSEKPPECECYQWPRGRKCDPGKRKHRLVPERFVVVCPEGHIDDFPVAEWLHSDGVHNYNPATCTIRRSTGGVSSSLSGVFYECSCGAKRSLAGVQRPGALARIGYHCSAARPWLGITADEDHPCPCDAEDLRVLLRGATNVWFADTRSSIHIPLDDDKTSKAIVSVLDRYYDTVSDSRVNGEFNRDIIDFLAKDNKVDPDELYAAFLHRSEQRDDVDDVGEDISEDQYRTAEYNVLIKTSGSDAQDFKSISIPISRYNPIIQSFFSSISLVPKLRETRAFVGFSRLEPNEKKVSERKKELRRGSDSWLPAIEVYGEGIFFEFNKERVESWAQSENVQARFKALADSFSESKFGENSIGRLRPEYVLIHTFAHLLINQLSFNCGYGSSSIRERIYCEKTTNELEMYGVLLYTASGDSEGSLGGLVQQGEAGKIEDTILDAVRNARWCTSDPVCIQSRGQGPESCNLAACHNCALLPETCCETGNRLLDRALIVGTLEDSSSGYFAGMLNE